MSSKGNKSGQNTIPVVVALLGVLGAIGAAIVPNLISKDNKEFEVRQFLNSAVSNLKFLEDEIDKCNPNEPLCTLKNTSYIGGICDSATSKVLN